MQPDHVPWHMMVPSDILASQHVDSKTGLTEDTARSRQIQYGKNTLERKVRFRSIKIFLAQFASPLVMVLVAAGIATLFLQEFLDSIVIGLALAVNIVIGAVQEGRASKVFEALKASQEKEAVVLRDGHKKVIAAMDLVVGDIVYLEGGKTVPADLRLMAATNLSINEAALTGEWVAVEKNSGSYAKERTLNEQKNMAWSGTTVSEGFGTGVVVAIGSDTEIGRIAGATEEVTDQETPLQKSVQKLARFLMIAIGISIVAIILLGLFRGEAFVDMLLIAIAVAVAAMPAGLPAAVTVVLAIGMEAILKKGGLVRSLLAAETLGSTTVILTDKTGTLTEGNMKAVAFYTARSIAQNDTSLKNEDNRVLLTSAVLSSDAFAETTPEGMKLHGRPIEKAIIAAGLEAGFSQDELFSHGNNRIGFLQFESSRRFSASLNDHNGGRYVYLSGAPERLLELAAHSFALGGKREMDDKTRELFKRVQDEESALGRRFIAVAYQEHKGDKIPEGIIRDGKPDNLVFVGLIAFADTVRADVASEIQRAKEAGIRIVMVTGDHQATAHAIAQEVGICDESEKVLTGRDVADMDDVALSDALSKHLVFARVLPEQKLRIVRILRNNGEVVAMTGDGVNDAPALVSADIGVAVGSGTDVAKEAADIVLLDNTFSTITAAIQEGRRIVANLRKIVAYLLSTGFSEIIVIGGALAAGAPLPLLPAQILWANLVEEGLMSFPFAFEPAEKGTMKKPPVAKANGKGQQLVLPREAKRLIIVITGVTGTLLLSVYFYLRSLGLPIEEIRTVMFVALSLDSIFFALSFKDLSQPLWRISIFNNLFLFIALGISVLLLVAAITWAPLVTLLSLTALTAFDVGLLAILAVVNLVIIEFAKYWVRR